MIIKVMLEPERDAVELQMIAHQLQPRGHALLNLRAGYDMAVSQRCCADFGKQHVVRIGHRSFVQHIAPGQNHITDPGLFEKVRGLIAVGNNQVGHGTPLRCL